LVAVNQLNNLALLSPASQSWRTFAVSHATSPMQHPTWLDVLTRAYGLEARIIALTDPHGEMLAALPMIRSKVPWRRCWTALPFTDTFEPVAVDAQHRDELLVAAAKDGDNQPILVRTHAPLAGWFTRKVGTVQVLDVSNGVEGVLRSADAHHRRNVKRAQRPEAGLTAKPIGSRSEFLGAGLSLMAQSRRRLGAPTQPRRYWSQVWQLHEQDEALTIGVYLGDKLVASGIFIIGGNHAVYKYGASDARLWKLRTTYLMFATAFDHIAARGVQSMDLGISDLSNTLLREYKSRWGGEEQPAHFSATDAQLLPDTLEPGRLLTQAIQNTPVFVGRTIGSLGYPFVA
jgi:CelD/BcsL family acetyltransferase involved in cellulose biosynthesis